MNEKQRQILIAVYNELNMVRVQGRDDCVRIINALAGIEEALSPKAAPAADVDSAAAAVRPKLEEVKSNELRS